MTYTVTDLDREAYETLLPIAGIEDPDALYEQMTYNGTIYSTELKGISAMSRAMAETGFTENGRISYRTPCRRDMASVFSERNRIMRKLSTATMNCRRKSGSRR